MIIGIPKEIKNNENRVALTPMGAAEFVRAGHTVLVERSAGAESGFQDSQYEAAGAVMVDEAAAVWAKSEMVMKVKEPLAIRVWLLPYGACAIRLPASGC